MKSLVAAVVAVIVVIAAVVTVAILNDRRETAAALESRGPAEVVREDSHRLDEAADGKVTLVEFLDFECEACGAAYPFIEQTREEYAGRITYVIRYFPLPGHANSMTSALAAEAAAQQGRLEEMYHRLFETQPEWGERQDSQAPLFRSFAEEIGLDMDAYDEAVADPATQARVDSDVQDGIELGVQGTPTFFLNGEELTAQTVEEFWGAIDDALR